MDAAQSALRTPAGRGVELALMPQLAEVRTCIHGHEEEAFPLIITGKGNRQG